MSLEDELRSNTVAMDTLNQSIDELKELFYKLLQATEGDLPSSKKKDDADHKVEKESPKEEQKEAKTESKTPVKESDEPDKKDKDNNESKKDSDEPVHTQKELKDLLNEYKEKHGYPLAKKLLPKMTQNKYKTSSDVPPNEIDELYDRVHEVVYGVEL